MWARGAGGRWIAVLAALALSGAAAGCGVLGDDRDGADGTDPDIASTGHLRLPEDLDPEAGCGDEASTDVADLAADRPVARCAPEAPAAVPLPAPATVRVGVRDRSEDVAPVLLAEHFGELEAENLTVEIREYDTADDLYGALDRGDIDVVASDLDGPFFDSVFNDSGARVVMGGPVAPEAHDTRTDQAGLWLRTDLLDEPGNWIDLEEVEQGIGVEDSIGDAAVYPVNFVLQQDDISLNEVRMEIVGGEEAAEQLLDERLAGAWLTDPHWRQVVDSDLQIELVATLPVAESLGGVVFAEHLLDGAADRAVGVAFVRAVIRTINTYLGGDYQDDDEVVAALTEVTGLDEEDIVDTPAWVFDWEVRSGTTTRIQESFVLLGGVIYEEDLPEQRLVDRTLYRDALAAPR